MELDVYVNHIAGDNPGSIDPGEWYHVILMDVFSSDKELLEIKCCKYGMDATDGNNIFIFRCVNNYDINPRCSKIQFNGKLYSITNRQEYTDMVDDFCIWYKNEMVNEVLDNI